MAHPGSQDFALSADRLGEVQADFAVDQQTGQQVGQAPADVMRGGGPLTDGPGACVDRVHSNREVAGQRRDVGDPGATAASGAAPHRRMGWMNWQHGISLWAASGNSHDSPSAATQAPIRSAACE